ncbi:glycine-rich cell wall structural protein 1-like [Salvia splendens]|uniref:glycine-rich cell wall structural protein 1-like n=1 Tax=Salvia splendens TaxID=180675 RepID=UPI001C26677E|nr:glycine-rich cell wall structural protein 1-like [Salvia splendens]
MASNLVIVFVLSILVCTTNAASRNLGGSVSGSVNDEKCITPAIDGGIGADGGVGEGAVGDSVGVGVGLGLGVGVGVDVDTPHMASKLVLVFVLSIILACTAAAAAGRNLKFITPEIGGGIGEGSDGSDVSGRRISLGSGSGGGISFSLGIGPGGSGAGGAGFSLDIGAGSGGVGNP